MNNEKAKKVVTFIVDHAFGIAMGTAYAVVVGACVYSINNRDREYKEYLGRALEMTRTAYNEMLMACKDAIRK